MLAKQIGVSAQDLPTVGYSGDDKYYIDLKDDLMHLVRWVYFEEW